MKRVMIITKERELFEQISRNIANFYKSIDLINEIYDALLYQRIQRKIPDIIISDDEESLKIDLYRELKNNTLTCKIPIISIINHPTTELLDLVDISLSKPFDNIAFQNRFHLINKLNNLEHKFNNLYDNMNCAIMEIDYNYTIINSNRYVDNLFIMPHEELIGKKIIEIFPSKNVLQITDIMNKIYVSKTPTNFSYNLIISGEKYWFDAIIIPESSTTCILISNNVTAYKNNVKIQSVLYNISKASFSLTSLDDFYKLIHNELNTILDATNFYISFYNSQTNEIISPYFYDENHTIKLPLKMRNNGITNYIIKTKKPLYLDDDVRNFLIKTGKISNYQGKSKMLLGVPLILDNNVIGTINIRTYNESVSYTHHHLEILEFIADQIVKALTQKRFEKQLEKSLHEKETLLQELHHRTKNNMQVIISMLSIQAKQSQNQLLKSKFQDISNRISTMSLAQEKLYHSNDLSKINLKEYITDLFHILFRSYRSREKEIELEIDISDVPISIDTAMPLGLILNELTSNVFKHAFKNQKNGKIKIIMIYKKDNTISIKFSDNGIGIHVNNDLRKTKTMGVQNIFSIVEYQLNGTAEYISNDGLSWDITIFDNIQKPRI